MHKQKLQEQELYKEEQKKVKPVCIIQLPNKNAINRFKKSIPLVERFTGLLLIFIALQIFLQDGNIMSKLAL